MPSMRSSAWIRGAPHRGLAVATLLTRVLIAASMGGRPAGGRPERVIQWRRKRRRCQLSTVAGATITRGLLPGGPHPGQPDPQEAIAPLKSRPVHRPLVDGQLLPQGEVLEGELALAAAQEREEPEHVEQEGDHRAGFSPDQSRLINQFAADEVLAKPQGRNLVKPRLR